MTTPELESEVTEIPVLDLTDEELAVLGRLVLEGHMRHAVQSFHDLERMVRHDLEATAYDLHVHHEGTDAGLYVQNRWGRGRVGCS